MQATIVFNDGSKLTFDDVDYAEPSTANPDIFIFERRASTGTTYLKLDSVIYIDLQEVDDEQSNSDLDAQGWADEG